MLNKSMERGHPNQLSDTNSVWYISDALDKLVPELEKMIHQQNHLTSPSDLTGSSGKRGNPIRIQAPDQNPP